MFGFIGGFPRRVKHLLSKLKKHFTKPQYDNFCRVTMGLMTAGKKEHDVKSMNELFIDRKDQSSLNRFITESNWNAQEVAKAGQTVLLCEAELNPTVEHKVVDDTVCRKYSPKTEMACYNHSSTMGTVLSHDYVTALSVNNDVAFGDGLKLYGNKKKCDEKGVTFKTRLELACELIDEHKPMADSTIMLWDSWYMCQEMVERCESHGMVGWARLNLTGSRFMKRESTILRSCSIIFARKGDSWMFWWTARFTTLASWRCLFPSWVWCVLWLM